MERTLFIIKPDGVKRGIIGQILSRIEQRGFHIEQMKMVEPNQDLIDLHYQALLDKPFYPAVRNFMLDGPIVVGVLAGEQAISGWRTMMGATRPEEALPGTIRGDFAQAAAPGQAIQNIVHGSDSPESAEREIRIWFGH
ncbi:nucleoside-diphosphate kinase [Streptococcus massiliensis]|uniref:Nucleoside diphosphate kinase n=1 Tax=Streptococcus massiliensis TaxID=313439 RepID=A0A380KXK2_9STRE|nr:nucleoside-diphosphate kinase [Streptococcus massiliensis]SUN75847.1 nucleoside diphosphate kinase [Streptococcus massiliensis]